jgi:hypothetical protein
MRPDQDRRVLAGVRVRPETVRHPGVDLVWFGRTRGVGCVDRVDGRVSGRRAYGATQDIEGLGLLEVDVQGRGLRAGGARWKSVVSFFIVR